MNGVFKDRAEAWRFIQMALRMQTRELILRQLKDTEFRTLLSEAWRVYQGQRAA